MTFVYRDPTALVSTLTPLVELAEKVGRARSMNPSDELGAALTDVESHIAQQVRAALRDAAAEGTGGDEPQTFKIGDHVRVACITCRDGNITQADVGDVGVIIGYDATGEGEEARMCWEVRPDGERWTGWHGSDELVLVRPRTPTDVPK